MPKDEGQGLMVSEFVCPEYGFNWTLTQAQLDEINEFRKTKNTWTGSLPSVKQEVQSKAN